MKRSKTFCCGMLIVVLVGLLSCTTLGKPIEECFTAKDSIALYNTIGIVSYKVNRWEYRFCLSNTDNTDIVIDGTIKNLLNSTVVDITFDDFTIKGKIDYKHHVIGNDININFNDGKISGTVRIKDDDEIWDVKIYDKMLRGLRHCIRDDSEYTMKYGDEDITGMTKDIFMGFSTELKIGGRHIYGRTKNALFSTKYFFRSDDMSEEDVMAYFVLDLVRLLRGTENKRR